MAYKTIKILIMLIISMMLFSGLVFADESVYFELLGTTGYQDDIYEPYSKPVVYGDVVFVGSANQYISSWNISNLSNIVELDAQDDFGEQIYNVELKEYLDGEVWIYYVMSDYGYIGNYNVTDPSAISGYDDYEEAYGEFLEIIGDLAYSTGDYIYIHNISNRTDIVEVNYLDIPIYPSDAVTIEMQDGIYIFIASSSGLVIYNVTDPNNIYNVSTYYESLNFTGGQGVDVDVVNEIAFFSSGNYNALASLDISDLSNPVKIDQLYGVNETHYVGAYQIRYYDGVVYVAGYGSDNVVSLNVSDPYNLKYMEEISGSGSPNYLDDAYRINVIDHSRIYVSSISDGSVSIFSHCGEFTCTSYDTCQPDVTGGYIPCLEVTSEYCDDAQYQNNNGDYSELQTPCNYCTAEESEVVGECEINPETEFQSYRKYHNYTNNNATCCAVTGNSTDCDLTESYWEDCGIDEITGSVIADDPVFRATNILISFALVIVVMLFILVGAYHNMKGKGKGELIK